MWSQWNEQVEGPMLGVFASRRQRCPACGCPLVTQRKGRGHCLASPVTGWNYCGARWTYQARPVAVRLAA